MSVAVAVATLLAGWTGLVAIVVVSVRAARRVIAALIVYQELPASVRAHTEAIKELRAAVTDLRSTVQSAGGVQHG